MPKSALYRRDLGVNSILFFGWLMTHDALAEDPQRRCCSSASAEHVGTYQEGGGQRNKHNGLISLLGLAGSKISHETDVFVRRLTGILGSIRQRLLVA